MSAGERKALETFRAALRAGRETTWFMWGGRVKRFSNGPAAQAWLARHQVYT